MESRTRDKGMRVSEVRVASMLENCERVLMGRGGLSVCKAAPLRIGLLDSSLPTCLQQLGLPLQSQSVPSAAVRASYSLEDRLTYFPLLDEISSCLRYLFQCLRDVVGGHPLCPKIQDHAFFIVPPIDPINEIITTRPQDMDRAHGALLPSTQESILFLIFLVGI